MFKALLNVLRGRPTIYRAKFTAPIHLAGGQNGVLIKGVTVDPVD